MRTHRLYDKLSCDGMLIPVGKPGLSVFSAIHDAINKNPVTPKKSDPE
jgi:hypothetical protein